MRQPGAAAHRCPLISLAFRQTPHYPKPPRAATVGHYSVTQELDIEKSIVRHRCSIATIRSIAMTENATVGTMTIAGRESAAVPVRNRTRQITIHAIVPMRFGAM